MATWIWIVLAFWIGGSLGYLLGYVRTSRALVRSSRLRYD